MSTSLNPTKLDLSDYTRPLPPLFGAVRLGHDVTFRLAGAGIGFVALVFALYHLAPVFLRPEAVTGAGLR